jgi:hypothetical protein
MIAAAIAAFDPLEWLDEMELISLDNLGITKVPDILQSNANAPVVILGSSLMLFPAYRLDDELGLTEDLASDGTRRRLSPSKEEHIYKLLSYSRAGYLEQLLRSHSQQAVTVTNAAVAGSLVSDQYLIAKKYLASGKRPKLFLITIAPRDFLDNERKEVDRTATKSVLADFVLPNEFAAMLMSDPANALSKSGALVHTALNGSSGWYKYRADLQQLVSGVTARVTGHPVSLIHVAEHANKPVQGEWWPKAKELADAPSTGVRKPKPNTLADLPAYRKMYLPVNQELFQQQRTAFGNLLHLLRSENIPVLVVNMPLTKENLAILPDTVLNQYQTFVRSTCQAYGAQLWQPELNLTRTDFSDSAHLNSSGGKKFFAALDSHIAARGVQL